MIIKRKSVIQALGFVGFLWFVSTRLSRATYEDLLHFSSSNRSFDGDVDKAYKLRNPHSSVNLSAPGTSLRFFLLLLSLFINNLKTRYMQKQKHDITGELGRPVIVDSKKLKLEERRRYVRGWKRNSFNQYASDMISVYRSLPDLRDSL